MDPLSGMPKAILHHILARLPDKDAAKTIVLSKTWTDIWYSFPNLSVQGQYFYTEVDVSLKNSQRSSVLGNLINYVTKRLLRLRNQGLAIKEFKLKLNLRDFVDPTPVTPHLDQWIQMASESGVEVLELQLGGNDEDKLYDLPLCVIEAKSLTKLKLGYGIRIGEEFLKLSMKLSMKLSSLKMLSLCLVLLPHEGIIEHLISLCPLIEHLDIYSCYHLHNHLPTGLHPDNFSVKSLFLLGLQKLKEVRVDGIQEIHIDSPNLENLLYFEPWNLNPTSKLNFDSCTTLRSLALKNLRSTHIVDKWFVELFSKHPFLESLELYECSMSERINISSAQLKVLELRCCSNLKEINVDTPNLLSFWYDGNDKAVISFMTSSNLLKVKVNTIVDFKHYCSLREFILNIPQKILWYIQDERTSRYRRSSSLCPLLNYLLSSCFPKTISFIFGGPNTFIEFFYDMVMGSKKGECHCSSSDTKCWWHSLKIVNISYSFMTNTDLDFKAMLDLWPESRHAITTFSLEM